MDRVRVRITVFMTFSIENRQLFALTATTVAERQGADKAKQQCGEGLGCVHVRFIFAYDEHQF